MKIGAETLRSVPSGVGVSPFSDASWDREIQDTFDVLSCDSHRGHRAVSRTGEDFFIVADEYLHTCGTHAGFRAENSLGTVSSGSRCDASEWGRSALGPEELFPTVECGRWPIPARYLRGMA